MDTNKLALQIAAKLTSGWSAGERRTQWKPFLEDEIKPNYPLLYELLKKIKSVMVEDLPY